MLAAIHRCDNISMDPPSLRRVSASFSTISEAE
jgi:hypothetical protein